MNREKATKAIEQIAQRQNYTDVRVVKHSPKQEKIAYAVNPESKVQVIIGLVEEANSWDDLVNDVRAYFSPYPVSDELERLVSNLDVGVMSRIGADEIIGAVREYEHGTADVSDIEGVTLKQYAAVAHDIIMILSAQA
jgi:hypothetical protein